MLDNEKPEKEREGKSSQELGESLFNNTPTQAVESDSDSKTGRKMNSEAETEAPAEENDSLLQETDDNVKYYYVQLSSESCTPATEERYAKKIED